MPGWIEHFELDDDMATDQFRVRQIDVPKAVALEDEFVIVLLNGKMDWLARLLDIADQYLRIDVFATERKGVRLSECDHQLLPAAGEFVAHSRMVAHASVSWWRCRRGSRCWSGC